MLTGSSNKLKAVAFMMIFSGSLFQAPVAVSAKPMQACEYEMTSYPFKNIATIVTDSTTYNTTSSTYGPGIAVDAVDLENDIKAIPGVLDASVTVVSGNFLTEVTTDGSVVMSSLADTSKNEESFKDLKCITYDTEDVTCFEAKEVGAFGGQMADMFINDIKTGISGFNIINEASASDLEDAINLLNSNYKADVTENGLSFNVLVATKGINATDVFNHFLYKITKKNDPNQFQFTEVDCPVEKSITTSDSNSTVSPRNKTSRSRARTNTEPKTSASCPYFIEYSTISNPASSLEVVKIQEYLNIEIDAGLVIDGIHGDLTSAAISKYQEANQEVLAGWQGNISGPTGNWMYSTRNHANEVMGCDEGAVVLGSTGIVIN